MSERFDQPDQELEAALAALGEHVQYPETPDLASAVRQRIEAGTPTRRRLVGFPRRWLAAAAVLALLVAGATLAHPASRTAVADLFDIPGITLIADDSIELPAVGEPLDLGEPVSLDEAQAGVSFQILVPDVDRLGEPDEIYLDEQPHGGGVTFVYHADEELETTAETGVGILLTQFLGDINRGLYGKGAPEGVDVESFSLAGQPAYWLSGAPHPFGFRDANGNFVSDTVRYAGNTLLWQAGDLTIRLESALDRETVIEIAEAMR